MSTAAPIDAGELPPEWREHYADLAADWVRERGTLPPSLEALARWGAEVAGVSLEEELAYLEGRGVDPVLTVRLTRGYFRTARHLAPTGSTTAAKLAETLRGLAAEPVPDDGDEPDLLPPVLKCWTRRVPGTALAVMFERRDDAVLVFAVRLWP